MVAPKVSMRGIQPAVVIRSANARSNLPAARWLGKMTKHASGRGCFRTCWASSSRKEGLIFNRRVIQPFNLNPLRRKSRNSFRPLTVNKALVISAQAVRSGRVTEDGGSLLAAGGALSI